MTAGGVGSGQITIFAVNNGSGKVQISVGRVESGQENGSMGNSGLVLRVVPISLIPETKPKIY